MTKPAMSNLLNFTELMEYVSACDWHVRILRQAKEESKVSGIGQRIARQIVIVVFGFGLRVAVVQSEFLA